MKSKNINRILFINLLSGGFVIALVAGVVTSGLEFRRIDRQLADLSFSESKKLAREFETYAAERTETNLLRLKTAAQKRLNHDRFIYIEFLDNHSKNIASLSLGGLGNVLAQINAKAGQFKMTGNFEYKTIYQGGQLFIKVMVPIKSDGGQETIGHFQGIYHLSDEAFSKLKDQSLYTIFLTILTVLGTTIFIYPVILILKKKLEARSVELLRSNTGLLKSLGSAVAERDSDTNAHNFRVTVYAVKIAEKMGCKAKEIRALIKGAFLHDIGKIGISDTLLLKPGKLTDDEFDTIKQHVAIGVKIVRYNDWLKDAMDVIQYHHEKHDGTGYLAGLKDKEIPVNAKIFAICDVFDALTSKRPYKDPFSFEESMEIMRKSLGTQFDPGIFAAFEGIAQHLHGKISLLNKEEHLNAYLDTILNTYFSELA